MIRVGVSGLTGMIGKNLVTQHARHREAKESLELIAFTRRESDTSFLQGYGIECRRIDYGNEESFSGTLEDIDVFLHLAGLTKSVTPSGYYRVNVDGTAALLGALSRYGKGVKHLIFASSTSATGPTPFPDKPKTEEDPCTPISHYGKSKLEAEELIRSSSVNWTILRLPIVFGPHDYDMLYMFRIAKSGVITLFSSQQDPYSYVSAPDAGFFFLQAVRNKRLYRETYCYCYDAPLTGAQFVATVREQLGLSPEYRYIQVPRWVAHPARAILGLKQRMLQRTSIVNPDKIAELAIVYWVFSNSKLKNSLGITSIKDNGAVAETVRWYREHRLL
jgi:nucleoside-diphosphate-sugar epimerase